MDGFSRFAIYLLPPEGPLARFGAAWLGWDCLTGQACEHPDIPGLPAPVEELTRTPRKYGFHGTIKPPFRLARGYSAEDLANATAAFCNSHYAISVTGLSLNAGRSGFVALRPIGDQDALASLASAAVQVLDPFRAPAPEAELARRRSRGLTDAQEANLIRWGYPYVMDEFHFHMTLTKQLSAENCEMVARALSPRVEPLLPQPFPIMDLCLAGEAQDGRFHLIKRFPLAG